VTVGALQYGPEWSAALRRGSDADLDAWLEFAIGCADAADEIALRHFRRDLEITAKPDRTFVTQADRAIETLIRERLVDRFPDHGAVGEELGTATTDSGIRWFIDPIDGTHNFIRGVPLFGLLLAAERDGELQVGVVSAPALGARWWASRGRGAWATRALGRDAGVPTRIHVSGVADIGEAQIVHASVGDLVASGRTPGIEGLLRAAWRERGFGDFWGYALVAEGAAEAMVEPDLSPWDLAAPAVVVEEAGGRVTDLDGVRSIWSRHVLASNGLLHDEILARLRAA
jgi:histidinol-phosphatase